MEIHPEPVMAALTTAIIVLYKANKSGVLRIEGFFLDVLKLLVNHYRSKRELEESLIAGIQAFDANCPVAEASEVKKFIEPYTPWGVIACVSTLTVDL
jgi:hypothetical protein